MIIRKYIQAVLTLCCSMLLLASCGGSKKLGDKTATQGTKVPQQAIKPEDYYKQVLQYKSFFGKANMQVTTSKMNNQKVTANIKMNHLKDIWSSVSAMGGIVEVVRAYITPDSLKALLPMSRDAYALSFEEGLSLIQAELEFVSLQNLFLGNPLLTGKSNAKISQPDSATIQVQVEQDGYILTVKYDKDTQLIREQLITHTGKNFSCKILQDNYKPLADKQPFAFNRIIEIDSNGEHTRLQLDFTRADIDVPADASLKIPESYTLQSIKK